MAKSRLYIYSLILAFKRLTKTFTSMRFNTLKLHDNTLHYTSLKGGRIVDATTSSIR